MCHDDAHPTACVFHLMRVLETGVQAFGKILKITINPKAELWAKIVDHIVGVQAMRASGTYGR